VAEDEEDAAREASVGSEGVGGADLGEEGGGGDFGEGVMRR